MITNFAGSGTEREYLLLGPECIRSNYEYRGDFLLSFDKHHFGSRGYEKLGRDLVDTLENEMVKIEFEQFKEYLR